MRKKDSPIEMVVFDVGNVLLGFSIEKAGQNFDALEQGAGARLGRALWGTALGRRFERGHFHSRGFFEHIKRVAKLSMGYRAFCEAFNEIFTPISENLKILKRLRRRRKTALLSNTNPIHWKYMLERFPLLREAHWPLSSWELKALKPDPKIYHRLSHKTRTALEHMAFFDDLEPNVLAARRVGMRAVLVDGKMTVREHLERWEIL